VFVGVRAWWNLVCVAVSKAANAEKQLKRRRQADPSPSACQSSTLSVEFKVIRGLFVL
jgi:hypothetical protein